MYHLRIQLIDNLFINFCRGWNQRFERVSRSFMGKTVRNKLFDKKIEFIVFGQIIKKLKITDTCLKF